MIMMMRDLMMMRIVQRRRKKKKMRERRRKKRMTVRRRRMQAAIKIASAVSVKLLTSRFCFCLATRRDKGERKVHCVLLLVDPCCCSCSSLCISLSVMA